MKKIFFIAIVMIAAFSANAQLSKTKWKTTLQIDNGPVEVIFDFSKDSLTVYSLPDNRNMETMSYKTKDKVLSLTKAYGQSSCDTQSPGKYKYEIVKDEMLLVLVSDDCADRSGVINNIKLNKVKK